MDTGEAAEGLSLAMKDGSRVSYVFYLGGGDESEGNSL